MLTLTHRTSRPTRGFTIVELLVVVVVIAILAAITVVAYNGIRDRAIDTAVQSDLRSAAEQAQADQATTGSYPSDGSSFKSSNGTSYQYSVNNTTSPQTFCLTASNGKSIYNVNQTGQLVGGACTGHVNGVGSSGIAWNILPIPTSYWTVALVSSDATKLMLFGSEYFSRSTDSGATWAAQSKIVNTAFTNPPGFMSSDGSRVFGSSFFNGTSSMYRSTNVGTSWSIIGGQSAERYAGSTDGSKLYYSQVYDNDSGTGGVYRSTDAGSTWTATPLSTVVTWSALASSGDGARVLVGSLSSSYLKISTNSGVSWTDVSGAGQRAWTSVAMSSDGTKLAAIGGSVLYLSTNSGTTWIAQSGVPAAREVAISADGSKFIVTPATTGSLYTSSNGGSSWNQETPIGQGQWFSPTIASGANKWFVIKSVDGTGILYSGR